MANIFKSIPKPRLRRNTFNLSHEVKLTTDFGLLTPILCEPVVPGDTWSCNTDIFIRVAPLLAPVMHRVNVYTHFFFVPNRLIWSNWEKFITGGPTGTEEPAYPRIQISSVLQPEEVKAGSLMDYLDFPTLDSEADILEDIDNIENQYFDALPFRAYQLIYNEYYRDENLEDEIDIAKDVDGLISDTDYIKSMIALRKRAWEKDYFTSALPWTQRGAETTIGLSGNAPVRTPLRSEGSGDIPASYEPLQFLRNDGYKIASSEPGTVGMQGVRSPYHGDVEDNVYQLKMAAGSQAQLMPQNLYADLSEVNATTINELRRAIQLQQYKEVLARSGSRYIELIRGLFGVVSSDARLQRPEFLGGGKTPMPFGEVLQTSETTGSSPLANMAGRGTAFGSTHSFKKFFEEHGYIIGIMSVMPKPSYQQGMPRKYYKFDRLDHFIPQFANIGEQEILNQELVFTWSNTPELSPNTNVFGYTPRYAEYKYLPSRVHGQFKTNLDFWHMGREFDNVPLLNHSFVEMNRDEISRVYAVTDNENNHLWCMLYHNIKATRPMPKFGVPLI